MLSVLVFFFWWIYGSLGRRLEVERIYFHLSQESLTFGRTERDLSSYIPEYAHSVFSFNTNVYYIRTSSCCKVCDEEL